MATYSTPIPGIPQYGQAALLAKQAYQNALARLNQQRSGTLRRFGYRADIDPEHGVVRNLRIDPHNSFGLLQEANRSQANRAERAVGHFIERGLGAGGGLAAQAQKSLRHEFDREDTEIGTALTEALGGFQDQQSQAGYARDRALYEAELAAVRDALMERLFNPPDLTDLELPPYPDSGMASDEQVPPPLTPWQRKKATNRSSAFVKAM